MKWLLILLICVCGSAYGYGRGECSHDGSSYYRYRTYNPYAAQLRTNEYMRYWYGAVPYYNPYASPRYFYLRR